MKNSLNRLPRKKRIIPITSPTLPPFRHVLPMFEEIYSSNMITNHTFVKKFEQLCAHNLQVKHAIALNSCTSGLMLIIKALHLTGEIIIPSFTFHATGHAVIWNNLTPVFADCDPKTYTIDPTDVVKKITAKTSAIIGVHLFGAPCNIDALEKIAKKYKLKLIFDAAHGFGIRYKGRPVGSFGNAEAFSLSPTKLVTAAEGGIVTTNNDELAQLIRAGRVYGDNGDYNPQFSGLSSRMSEFHAAVGIVSLKNLEKNVIRRNMLVRLYKKYLSDLPGLTFQKIDVDCRSSYKDFSVCIDPQKFGVARDTVVEMLLKEGVVAKKYFYPALHLMNIFKQNGAVSLPHTERLSAQSLSIPLYSHMAKRDVLHIAGLMRKIHTITALRAAFSKNMNQVISECGHTRYAAGFKRGNI